MIKICDCIVPDFSIDIKKDWLCAGIDAEGNNYD